MNARDLQSRREGHLSALRCEVPASPPCGIRLPLQQPLQARCLRRDARDNALTGIEGKRLTYRRAGEAALA